MIENVLHISGRDGYLSGHGSYRVRHTWSIDGCLVSVNVVSYVSWGSLYHRKNLRCPSQVLYERLRSERRKWLQSGYETGWRVACHTMWGIG